MDLDEQNKLAGEIGKIILKRTKNMPFHAAVAVADESETGFAFSVSTLATDNSFQKCRVVVKGIADNAQALIDKFEMPSNVKLKKSLERK